MSAMMIHHLLMAKQELAPMELRVKSAWQIPGPRTASDARNRVGTPR